MKKNNFLCIILAFLVTMFCFASCANPENPNETPELGKGFDLGVDKANMAIADEKKHQLPEVTVEIPEEKQSLCITRSADAIRDYAIFLNTDSVEYTYYFNSNIIIGVDYNIHGDPVDSPKTEKEAEKIARDFLKEHFENYAFYDLFMINNFDSSHYYSVRFAYQRDGYAFQDIIVVNVNYGGEIMSVNAPHFGEYYDCPVTKEQIDKTVAALGDEIEPMGVFYDDNQVLCFTYIKDGMQYYVPIYAE